MLRPHWLSLVSGPGSFRPGLSVTTWSRAGQANGIAPRLPGYFLHTSPTKGVGLPLTGLVAILGGSLRTIENGIDARGDRLRAEPPLARGSEDQGDGTRRFGALADRPLLAHKPRSPRRPRGCDVGRRSPTEPRTPDGRARSVPLQVLAIPQSDPRETTLTTSTVVMCSDIRWVGLRPPSPTGAGLSVAREALGCHHGRPSAVGREFIGTTLSQGGRVTVAAGSGLHGSGATDRPPMADTPVGQGMTPVRATSIVVLVGLLITLSVSWTASTLNRHNEHRLLEVQTRQAVAVLSATIQGLRDPLDTALQLENATGGSEQQFNRFASTSVGPGRLFVSAILWKSDGTTWQPVSIVGAKPLMAPPYQQALALVDKAVKSPTFVVAPVPAKRPRRIGYAIADPNHPTLALYTERAIPANREVPVESGSAFSDLNFATYLGPTTSMSALVTTDLPLKQLPISGETIRASIPFGDSIVTLVTAPRGPLGGTLGGALPWVFLVGGLLVTVGAAVVTDQLVRRRRNAEQDARTIAGLYRRLDGLFGEQRSIAETLQRALIPQRNPSIPNLEAASRYLAGADGLKIGGDWFSLIEIDDRHFGFVVGDISGRGVEAAAVMARLRFTIRAYLTEGHSPDVVLEMCARQLSVNRDGHLATVLIGVGDADSGALTLANAGHLNPLRVSGTTAEFVRTDVGLPLGVAPSRYRATTVQMPSGSTLVAFTDGLVERRGESIDIGLERLVRAATDPAPTVDELLTRLTATLGPVGSDDDVAILAFRWTSPADEPAIMQVDLDRVS